ncbi:sulfurtransferase TusA family protein [Exiguobacterium sp. 17-1]|uniref:sulfurtransferase TusA family protein n=1 Tax=Exiguobacterium sp. 17-1 TaxID=2931981 RepID=UPI001FFEF278|nr:sulfurtransferase TusA family protein [Exiguobacterium sp. 17-1]MCK2158390.1 sulfurtransferase TusA family protein [Exiguobacterium sp. 17-1]
MQTIKTDIVLDARGLACPMPIVRTKKTMKTLEPGQVVEVQATDKGSTADLRAWANSTGNQYLGTIEDGDVLRHYVRKASGNDQEAPAFEQVVNNETVEAVRQNADTLVLDVRETAEYAFAHIPNALHIPLGELDARSEELDSSKTIYVVCRTGSRSDLACQQLAAKGFSVKNVVPGMSDWAFDTEKNV